MFDPIFAYHLMKWWITETKLTPITKPNHIRAASLLMFAYDGMLREGTSQKLNDGQA